MRMSVLASDEDANVATIKNDSEEKTASKTENEWFCRPASQMLGPDAGLALHYLTKAPESSCYRYMRGDSAIPIYRYRRLLHGPHGATWLNVIMDECKEVWWIRHQRAERIYNALAAELRE